jgi:predicted DNA-binding transcriptional regulator AlpA
MKECRANIVRNIDELPAMITAADLQRLGISRPIAYQMMKLADMPVIKIGRRFFIPKVKFLEWLDTQSKSKREVTLGEQ